MSGAVFSYKLRYIVGFWLVETAVSTNQKPTIYRNLYENTGPVCSWFPVLFPGNPELFFYFVSCFSLLGDPMLVHTLGLRLSVGPTLTWRTVVAMSRIGSCPILRFLSRRHAGKRRFLTRRRFNDANRLKISLYIKHILDRLFSNLIPVYKQSLGK